MIQYQLTWVSAPRPPTHPQESVGSQIFLTFEDAIGFMEKRPKDSRFVSLKKITTSFDDMTETARLALKKARGEL